VFCGSKCFSRLLSIFLKYFLSFQNEFLDSGSDYRADPSWLKVVCTIFGPLHFSWDDFFILNYSSFSFTSCVKRPGKLINCSYNFPELVQKSAVSSLMFENARFLGDILYLIWLSRDHRASLCLAERRWLDGT
jgi:hypothetical protein